LKEKAYISALVQKVRKKDVLAMQTLYESFSKEMMAASHRITNSITDSEDILQEAFLTSFQKIAQLKEDGKYSAWLKQIVINSSLKLVKGRRDFTALTEIEHIEYEESENNWYQGISFDIIKKALQNLPDGCREIFSLYALEGYKHKEIAAALDISVSTSKSQYRYALKLLREKLMDINL